MQRENPSNNELNVFETDDYDHLNKQNGDEIKKELCSDFKSLLNLNNEFIEENQEEKFKKSKVISEDMETHNDESIQIMDPNNDFSNITFLFLPEENEKNEMNLFIKNFNKCIELRHKYLEQSLQYDYMNPKNEKNWTFFPPHDATYRVKDNYDAFLAEIPDKNENLYYKVCEDGVINVFDKATEIKLVEIPSLEEYYRDISFISQCSFNGFARSFTFKRLKYLESKWNFYSLFNLSEEKKQLKQNPHRDFYNVRKVDTHIHHSSCMSQRNLLIFIKNKLNKYPDEKVIFRDGKILTLSEVFVSLNLSSYDLSIDTLDMHAHVDTFHRFDNFNLKYNPIGESRLREIFLKTDNYIKGRYLAELTKQFIDEIESSKYQMVELRISIYGKSIDEWKKLSDWIFDNNLFSPNVRWLIQVPRLYDIYYQNKNVDSFLTFLKNVFEPLFLLSIDPKLNPRLFFFLHRIVGFDSVDDELKSDNLSNTNKYPVASAWTFKKNPPYSYYIYYFYAYLTSLNVLRKKTGLNTFVLRPHCGEAGSPSHLIDAFLTSHSISHGISLNKSSFLQYLFYIDQIGISMSPLSNNALFLSYKKNPFYKFFSRGLNVSLSTDDPLQFSYTKEPLIEEYSIAAQIYKLSSVDICELALNSLKQSGWEHSIKSSWLGENFFRDTVYGNDIHKTNVPNMRLNFRKKSLDGEKKILNC